MAVIKLSEYHRVMGDSHHKAKLSDQEVDLIRALHEDLGLGYKRIAMVMSWFDNVSVQTVASICQYRRRACFTARVCIKT